MSTALLYVFMVMANMEHMSTAVQVDSMDECRQRAQEVVQLAQNDPRVLWAGGVCVPVSGDSNDGDD